MENNLKNKFLDASEFCEQIECKNPNKNIAWEKKIDFFIEVTDKIYFFSRPKIIQSWQKSKAHPLAKLDPKSLFQCTFFALIIVFVFLLLSCQTNRPLAVRRSVFPQQPPSDRAKEPLYIKRQQIHIEPNEKGSKTGSIWADSAQPRMLFTDAGSFKTGDVVLLEIPPELQFNPPSAKPSEKPGQTQPGKPAQANKGKTENPGEKTKPEAVATPINIDNAGSMSAMSFEPLTSMKLQIVAMDPNGDVYLKGQKEHGNHLGERRNLLVTAKMPKRKLLAEKIDARDLTEVEVLEEFGGQQSSYRTLGWDVTTSRKVSGFVPDINTEMSALDEVRDSLKEQQNSLREQQKAIFAEQERMRKERARNTALDERNKPPEPKTDKQEPKVPAEKK